MRSILIAHRDPAFAEHLESDLRAAGYRVILCPGPWPPARRCIRCDVGYCPLTEGVDLMIYDPELTGVDEHGRQYNLAVDSARAHPDVPLLLAWPATASPDVGTLRDVRRQALHARAAARTPDALLRQIDGLLSAATSPEVQP
jgi:hypothetical protein